MLTNNQDQFTKWLQNKSINDYWSGQSVDHTYSSTQLAHFRGLLENKELFPSSVTLFVSNACNLYCKHCGQSSGKALEEELSYNEILNLIPSLLDLRIKYVAFSGGEPFMRKDIFEIIKAFKDNGFIVGIVTNGLVNTPKLFDSIIKAEIDSISISIDGLKEIHNKIRQHSKSFDSAISFLKFISNETKVRMLSVTTCVSPGVVADLDELCSLIFERGVNSWVLRPIAPTGRAKLDSTLLLSDKEMMEFIDFCKRKVEEGIDLTLSGDVGYLGEIDSILRSQPYFSSLGWDSFQICANGDVKALSEEDLPSEGNIRERNLSDIWFNEFKLYRDASPDPHCLECRYYGKCGGDFIPNKFIDQSCLVSRGVVS